MTTCKLKSTDSLSSWIYSNTSRLAYDFKIPLKGFRLLSLVDLVVATSTTSNLEILQEILPIEDFREVWVQKP